MAVFVVTPCADENLIREALDAGARSVISKALGIPDIAKQVAKALRESVSACASELADPAK